MCQLRGPCDQRAHARDLGVLGKKHSLTTAIKGYLSSVGRHQIFQDTYSNTKSHATLLNYFDVKYFSIKVNERVHIPNNREQLYDIYLSIT